MPDTQPDSFQSGEEEFCSKAVQSSMLLTIEEKV
jgi:hypothetical protein